MVIKQRPKNHKMYARSAAQSALAKAKEKAEARHQAPKGALARAKDNNQRGVAEYVGRWVTSAATAQTARQNRSRHMKRGARPPKPKAIRPY